MCASKAPLFLHLFYSYLLLLLTHIPAKFILIYNMVDTKITHYLDQHNISYRILPHAEPVFTVEAAAAQRGVILEEMVNPSCYGSGVGIAL